MSITWESRYLHAYSTLTGKAKKFTVSVTEYELFTVGKYAQVQPRLETELCINLTHSSSCYPPVMHHH